MTNHNDSIRAQAYADIGRYLGFPECCIRAFKLNCAADTKKMYGEQEDKVKSPWYGTGFIPCMKCAPAAQANFEQFVAQNIAWRRQAPKPFPSEEGIEAFVEKVWAKVEKEERALHRATKKPASSSWFDFELFGVKFSW